MNYFKSTRRTPVLIKKRAYFICFLIALLPRLIFLEWTYPLNISVDEFSMFLPIVKYLGWDWSNMILKPLYYGYGFIVLLTPLFKWIDDPILLYRIIVVFMMLSQALIAPIAYFIVKKIFYVKKELFAGLIAIACSYLVTQRAVYIYNEFIYVLLVWAVFLILLLLQKAQDNRKLKRKYSVILALILSYAMTIHARAITLFIALGVLSILYYWLYRRHILSYVSFGLVGSIGYVLSTFIKNKIVVAIFSDVPGKVYNTTVSFSLSAITISPRAIVGWFDIIIGQINSMVIMTCGVGIVFILIGFIYIWKALSRDKILIKKGTTDENASYVVAFVFFLTAAAITILGQSFSWLPSVTETLDTGVQQDGLRALVYTRYYGAYLGPVVLAGMSYVFHNMQKVQVLIKPVIIIVVSLQCIWMMCVVPYLVGFTEGSFPSFIYSFTKGWQDNITFHSYLPAVVAVIVITILFCYLYKRNRLNLAFGIFTFVLVYGYCYQAIDYEGYRGVENFKGVDCSYKLLREIKETGLLPDTIYVQNSNAKNGGHATGCIYQFLFGDNKIIPEIPDENVKEAIFLTGEFQEYPDLLRQGYSCIQLEDGEFIYVKGEKLKKILEEFKIFPKKYLEYKETIELKNFHSDYVQNRGPEQIQSDGSEGFLFYGYRFPWGGGELKTTLVLELLDTKDDLVGTFELVKSNGDDAFYGQDIYASDFDENGKLEVEIPVNCIGNQILEQRLTIYEGSKVRVTGVSVKKSAKYEIGKNEESEVAELKRLLQTYPETIYDEVYYIANNDTCEYSTVYLEEKLGKKVVVIDSKELQNKRINEQNAILITEDQECVFEIAKKYSILTKIKGFTIFTPVSEVVDGFFQSEKGIRVAYFQEKANGTYDSRVPFKLSQGTYEISAEIMVKDVGVSDLTLKVSEFDKVIVDTDFERSAEYVNSYVAKARISSVEGFNELRVGIEYFFKGVEYSPDIYIKKIN